MLDSTIEVYETRNSLKDKFIRCVNVKKSLVQIDWIEGDVYRLQVRDYRNERVRAKFILKDGSETLSMEFHASEIDDMIGEIKKIAVVR